MFNTFKEIKKYECEISLNKLKMLHYLSPICDKDVGLPNYLKDFYYLVDELKSEDYLIPADLITFLNYKVNTSELKLFLKDHNLSTSGKKKDLIIRIINNIDRSTIENSFASYNYLTLSEKGKSLIEKYPKEFLKDAEINEIALKYHKSMNLEILEKFPEFSNIRIKALEPYKEYETEIKTFVLTNIDENLDFNQLKLKNNFKDLIFEKLFGITIPNGIFYHVYRYYKSIEDLKKYIKNNNSKISYNYTIRTAKDEKVCQSCSSIEGKKIHITEAIVGKNYPPFDNCKCEFCRCSVSVKININK